MKHYAHGKCTRCARPRKGRPSGYPRLCSGGCGRMVRRTDQKVADFPDTVPSRGIGICLSCSNGRPIPEAINHVRPCAGGCGRNTRPNSWRLDKAPDTVVRVARDRCGKCAAA